MSKSLALIFSVVVILAVLCQFSTAQFGMMGGRGMYGGYGRGMYGGYNRGMYGGYGRGMNGGYPGMSYGGYPGMGYGGFPGMGNYMGMFGR